VVGEMHDTKMGLGVAAAREVSGLEIATRQNCGQINT
jgi:hypothetical protein